MSDSEQGRRPLIGAQYDRRSLIRQQDAFGSSGPGILQLPSAPRIILFNILSFWGAVIFNVVKAEVGGGGQASARDHPGGY